MDGAILCGPGEPTPGDLEVVEAFGAWLRDPSSRCIICLGTDKEGAAWRTHRKHGQVFVCQGCLKKNGGR